MKKPPPDRTDKSIQNTRCSFCLGTLPELTETGLFGCSRCYEAFAGWLKKEVPGFQKGSVHRGRAPLNWVKKRLMERDLRQFEKEYHRCLVQENYEKAETLKKMILRIRTTLLP